MPKSNKRKKIIYMDYAASVLPNPSSIHKEGLKAKTKLINARIRNATLLNCRKEEIIFTNGGTESNNIAIQGIVYAWYKEKNYFDLKSDTKNKPHVIITNIEHASVLETCKALQDRKLITLSVVNVEKNGIIDPKKIKKAITKNTILVSVMYANNEIGTIQPIAEIAKSLRHYKKNNSSLNTPFFHTDAVQAINYLDLNVQKLGVDLLSLSGSKIMNSGEIGILYKKKSVKIEPILFGGNQELNLCPGTEDLKGILKFTKAFESLDKTKEKEKRRLEKLQNYFLNKIFENNSRKKNTKSLANEYGIFLNGDKEKRLPNNINITISRIPSDLLVIELSERNIMTSSKSACKSSEKGISYVIKAINPKIESEIGGIRFSFGQSSTKSDINYAISSLKKVLEKLKKWYIYN